MQVYWAEMRQELKIARLQDKEHHGNEVFKYLHQVRSDFMNRIETFSSVFSRTIMQPERAQEKLDEYSSQSLSGFELKMQPYLSASSGVLVPMLKEVKTHLGYVINDLLVKNKRQYEAFVKETAARLQKDFFAPLLKLESSGQLTDYSKEWMQEQVKTSWERAYFNFKNSDAGWVSDDPLFKQEVELTKAKGQKEAEAIWEKILQRIERTLKPVLESELAKLKAMIGVIEPLPDAEEVIVHKAEELCKMGRDTLTINLQKYVKSPIYSRILDSYEQQAKDIVQKEAIQRNIIALKDLAHSAIERARWLLSERTCSTCRAGWLANAYRNAAREVGREAFKKLGDSRFPERVADKIIDHWIEVDLKDNLPVLESEFSAIAIVVTVLLLLVGSILLTSSK
eukprot:GILI01012390.1.p1 GENE.GILI01012390.1~~GILI01012390.1.p1  ORF type:complete len:397 (-),score=67.56 GILI01012390.1:93-1283(-)